MSGASWQLGVRICGTENNAVPGPLETLSSTSMIGVEIVLGALSNTVCTTSETSSPQNYKSQVAVDWRHIRKVSLYYTMSRIKYDPVLAAHPYA